MSTAEATVATPTAKVPLGSLLIVALVAVVMAIGGCAGALLYLAKHGKLGAASAQQPQVVIQQVPAETPTRNVTLEPMLVNLADADGHAYLRIGVVLAEEIDPAKKSEKEEKPAPGANADLRDAVLTVLGRKRSDDLLAADGKEKLKDELKTSVNHEAPDAKVHAVYFTEFLVQR